MIAPLERWLKSRKGCSEDAAQLLATSTANWAATVGTPWSTYQSQQAAAYATQATSNDEAQLTDVIGDAQLIQANSYTTADATETQTDADAQATDDRTVAKIDAVRSKKSAEAEVHWKRANEQEKAAGSRPAMAQFVATTVCDWLDFRG